jgi:hypothetical protein
VQDQVGRPSGSADAAWSALAGIGAMFVGGSLPFAIVIYPALLFLPDDTRYNLQILAFAVAVFIGARVAARGGPLAVGLYGAFLVVMAAVAVVHTMSAVALQRAGPCCVAATEWNRPENVARSYGADLVAFGIGVLVTRLRPGSIAVGRALEAAGAYALAAITVGTPLELIARPAGFVEPRVVPYEIAGTPIVAVSPDLVMVTTIAAIAAGVVLGLRSTHLVRDALLFSVASVLPSVILQVGLDQQYGNTDWQLALEVVPAATTAIALTIGALIRLWTRRAPGRSVVASS